MRATRWVLLLGLATGCAAEVVDADWDGFAAEDDCDDTDALVYPGAPDAPGDGLDADCDGTDPDHAFTGTWSVVELLADYSTLNVIVPGSSSGAFDVDDEDALLQATIGLDPDLLGYELDLDIEFTGVASPTADRDSVHVEMTGEVGGESSTMIMDCQVFGDEDGEGSEVLDCGGVLKAIDLNLQLVAEFSRG